MHNKNKNVTQRHGNVPNLKHNLLSSESTIAKINIKNKQRNTEKLSCQTFSPEKKNWSKSHQNFSTWFFASWEIWYILLERLLPDTHSIIYPKCMGSGIQAAVKANELSLSIAVCSHGFCNGVMAHILQIEESTICRNFVAWLVLMQAIFPCLNLKYDEQFSPWCLKWCLRSFPEMNWSYYYTHNGTYICCAIEWNWTPSTIV